VPCVDADRSEKSEFGDISMEVFHDSEIPIEASIFKDPSTADVRIYINEEGRELVDKLITSAKLTGIECGALTPLLW
jgi:hypothetical protein